VAGTVISVTVPAPSSRAHGLGEEWHDLLDEQLERRALLLVREAVVDPEAVFVDAELLVCAQTLDDLLGVPIIAVRCSDSSSNSGRPSNFDSGLGPRKPLTGVVLLPNHAPKVR
jgi:hypothetical protein